MKRNNKVAPISDIVKKSEDTPGNVKFVKNDPKSQNDCDNKKKDKIITTNIIKHVKNKVKHFSLKIKTTSNNMDPKIKKKTFEISVGSKSNHNKSEQMEQINNEDNDKGQQFNSETETFEEIQLELIALDKEIHQLRLITNDNYSKSLGFKVGLIMQLLFKLINYLD